ncbi:hypothetical protein VTJ04DRAFT_2645 [Mycothermus thermophilus]|uniref:uncharacterized protein n=1 Tax=Humicola insolens TaxID=85995 RepID=UPI003742D625
MRRRGTAGTVITPTTRLLGRRAFSLGTAETVKWVIFRWLAARDFFVSCFFLLCLAGVGTDGTNWYDYDSTNSSDGYIRLWENKQAGARKRSAKGFS